MKKKVFIQTNNKQKLGALIAKYAIEKNASKEIPVEILNSDTIKEFAEFKGVRYSRRGRIVTEGETNDLQSFTLTRFMPPQKMNHQGLAIVIDPDIFALTDLDELFSFPLQGNAIAACKKNSKWDSSVMLLDCSKLKHWNLKAIMNQLRNSEATYDTWIDLEKETSVIELPRIWNSLDILTKKTKMLHTTNRITQPWKTGLPIDFTRNPMPKFFGLIPREPIHKLLGKYPTRYKPHPNKKIERLFFGLVREAINKKAISEEFVIEEISKGNIRKDIFKFMR